MGDGIAPLDPQDDETTNDQRHGDDFRIAKQVFDRADEQRPNERGRQECQQA